MAVRLPLLLTGNPEHKPAPRFATPRARNSWRASITSRPLAANARAVTMLSEYATTVTPSAGGQQRAQVDSGEVRNRDRRQTARDAANGLDPHLVEIEDGHDRCGKSHGDQGTGPPRQQSLKCLEEHEG